MYRLILKNFLKKKKHVYFRETLILYRTELLNKPIIGNTIYASTKWYNNLCIILLSNIIGAKPVQKIRKYSKRDKQNVEISCPNTVVTYNKFMGRVVCKGISKVKCMKCMKCILVFYPIFKLFLAISHCAKWWQIEKFCDKVNVHNVTSEQRTLNFL